MSITSERQRRLDPVNGGFIYYTLFHADKDERPDYAEVGDIIEEFGEGGKVLKLGLDAKGRKVWSEDAAWDRQTGGGSSGGGGLPANFPEEGASNANKLVGFDNSGDYAALDAPEELPSMTGKNGKVLGVTLDAQDHEQAEWVTPSGGADLPDGTNDGDLLVWDATDEEWKAAGNIGAPYNVVMSLDENAQEATFVSDKTFSEIFNAIKAGRRVDVSIPLPLSGFESHTQIFDIVSDNGDYTATMFVSGAATPFVGSATDHITYIAD